MFEFLTTRPQSSTANVDAQFRYFQIRPATGRDAQAQRLYFSGLSRSSLYLRFMSPLKQLSPSFEQRLFYPDGRRHFALIAEGPGDEGVIAEARYIVDKENPALCLFALSVGDAWQRKGIGTTLLHTLRREASKAGLAGMYAETLACNHGALALARQFECHVATIPGDYLTFKVSKRLRQE